MKIVAIGLIAAFLFVLAAFVVVVGFIAWYFIDALIHRVKG